MSDLYQLTAWPATSPELGTEFGSWMHQHMGRLSWETSLVSTDVLEAMVYAEDGISPNDTEKEAIRAWLAGRVTHVAVQHEDGAPSLSHEA